MQTKCLKIGAQPNCDPIVTAPADGNRLCGTCGGSGQVIGPDGKRVTCPTCGGKGEVPK